MRYPAIRVEGLGKRYCIGPRQPYGTLRDSLADLFGAPLRCIKRIFQSPQAGRGGDGGPKPQATLDSLWALKDVAFTIEHGEVVGVIGPNGAGKSTLLKVLCRITEPTEGYVEIRGRVGALLEVGTGFHPELTGRENIFLSGAILGMRKAEMKRKFDEMVSFAEVEKFIDLPVKHYSTGMTVRLAFAVAAHLEPEILLVDEILAVGDVTFQKKCMGKMDDVAKGGRTVLFVSHNMGAMRQLCRRAIWLNQGSIVASGDAQEIVGEYLAASSGGFIPHRLESEFLRIEEVILRDRMGRAKASFKPGEDLIVEVRFFAKRYIPKPFFWIGVVSQFGSLFGASMLLDGHQPDFIEGQGALFCTFQRIPLLSQTYSVRLGVRSENGVSPLVKAAEVAFFSVVGLAKDFGWGGEGAESLMGLGAPVFVPYRWQLPDGRTLSVEPQWAGPGP